jgi:SPP1 family predicted phage head-tail adaptor
MAEFRVNAGKYRHVVTFQRLIQTPNAYGEVSKEIGTNWEDAFKARVSILPVSGKQILAQEVEKGQITHRIYMRYQSGVDSTMRIVYGTRIFEIVSPPINFTELNKEIQLLVKEVEFPPASALDATPVAPVYASTPMAYNLAIVVENGNQAKLTWELDGATPPDLSYFNVFLDDVLMGRADKDSREYYFVNLTGEHYAYLDSVKSDGTEYYSKAVDWTM